MNQNRSIRETSIFIVTPSYNSEGTIARTINSVISQQGQFKLFYHIQDGGSNDGTLEICEKYKSLLSRGDIPLFCQNVSMSFSSSNDDGMYDAIWRGFNTLDITSDDWMAWINSDDILRPGACALLAEVDKQHGSNWIKWVGGRTSVSDNETGMQIGHGKRPHNRKAIQEGLCEGLHWDFIQQEGIFFRHSLWKTIDNDTGFRKFKFAGDWNLWRLFAKHAEFFQVPWATGSFFRVEGQISGSTRYLYEAEICETVPVQDRSESLLSMTNEDTIGYLIGTAYTTKEVFITKTDQSRILDLWQSKHLDKGDAQLAAPAVTSDDRHHYSSTLNIDRSSLPDCIVIHEKHWQYPAITEKHAALKAAQMLPERSDYCYFGFPWATLIDMIECGDNKRMIIMSELGSYRSRIKKFSRVFTTCQHVLQYKYAKLLAWMGITDVFWSHHTCDPTKAITNMNVKPFPLYPLQAVLHENQLSKISFEQRNIQCSFIGAKNCQGYMTQVRDWIVDELSGKPGFRIISRNQWHYQPDVYGRQISTTESEMLTKEYEENIIRQRKQAAEYVEVLMNSIFTLCPSGSGPNSIRLWESIMASSIPIVLSDVHILPGPSDVWRKAAVFIPEDRDSVLKVSQIIERYSDQQIQSAIEYIEQIKLLYGPNTFITDILSEWLDQDSKVCFSADLYSASGGAEGRFKSRLNRALRLGVDNEKKMSAIRTLAQFYIRQYPEREDDVRIYIEEVLKTSSINKSFIIL